MDGIYAIDAELRELMKEADDQVDKITGEIPGRIMDAILTQESAKQDRCLQIAAYVKELRAEEARLRELLESDIKWRMAEPNRLNRHANWLAELLVEHVPRASKWEDAQAKLAWKKNPPALEIRDVDAIPREFFNVPAEAEVEQFLAGKTDKARIKKALKDGEVAGCELKQSSRLEIK